MLEITATFWSVVVLYRLNRLRGALPELSFQAKSRNGASGTSDMDGNAAKVAGRESGDEQVQSLTPSGISIPLRRKTSLDMTNQDG
jgi:hypothetical protein